jgi:SPP1 gp7 family putative phage head morphogenesis protein
LLEDVRQEQGRADAAPEISSYRSLAGALRWQFDGLVCAEYGRRGELAFELPGSPMLVVMAGMHGEEQAGPRMLATHGAALVARARELGVGLRIYPCAVPEAFDLGARRDQVSTRMVEYLVGGEWQAELMGESADEERDAVALQLEEVSALARDLRQWLDATECDALVELREGDFLPAGYACGYMATAQGWRIAAQAIGRSSIPFASRPLRISRWTSAKLRTSASGLVECRDGGVADWAGVQGVPVAMALEATGRDLRSAVETHRSFVRSLMHELARGGAEERADAAPPRKVGTPRAPKPSSTAAGLAAAQRSGARAAELIDSVAREFRDKIEQRQLTEIVAKFGQRTDEQARAQLDRQLRASIGVPLSSIEKGTQDRLGEWTADNVALIKTVPERYFDRMQEDIQDAFAGGMHPDTLADDLEERYEMSRRDAERIARDQTLKLSADVNHDRMQSLGVERAIWRTVRDNRVSDDCFDLEGEEFDLAIGVEPDGLFPGSSHPQCRCFSEPVLHDLLGGGEDEESEE